MRVKILKTQEEEKINKEIEKLEKKDRLIEKIIPFGKKTWILHYEDNNKEVKSIREAFEELKKERQSEN